MARQTVEAIELDEAAIQELQRRATSSGRTIQEVAAQIIEGTLSADIARLTPDRRDWLAEIDRIRAMTPKGVEQPDSTEILRRMRDG
jgi:hypothetical protein